MKTFRRSYPRMSCTWAFVIHNTDANQKISSLSISTAGRNRNWQSRGPYYQTRLALQRETPGRTISTHPTLIIVLLYTILRNQLPSSDGKSMVWWRQIGPLNACVSRGNFLGSFQNWQNRRKRKGSFDEWETYQYWTARTPLINSYSSGVFTLISSWKREKNYFRPIRANGISFWWGVLNWSSVWSPLEFRLQNSSLDERH